MEQTSKNKEIEMNIHDIAFISFVQSYKNIEQISGNHSYSMCVSSSLLSLHTGRQSNANDIPDHWFVISTKYVVMFVDAIKLVLISKSFSLNDVFENILHYCVLAQFVCSPAPACHRYSIVAMAKSTVINNISWALVSISNCSFEWIKTNHYLPCNF